MLLSRLVALLRRIPVRPAYTDEPEWMDAPGHSRALIEDNLKDLRQVNRLLGGSWLTLRPLERVATTIAWGETLRVLDVATGAADIPGAVARWAHSSGRALLLVASDVSLDILAAGRDSGPHPPGIVFVVADATALPFRAGGFHVSCSSLALHHMLPDQAVAMLREQRRCTTVGVVVNDIVRSWLAYFGAILATRIGSSNVLTLHDGPLSVRRAFTVSEMRHFAREAGLQPVEWYSFLFYRVSFWAASTARATPSAAVIPAVHSAHVDKAVR